MSFLFIFCLIESRCASFDLRSASMVNVPEKTVLEKEEFSDNNNNSSRFTMGVRVLYSNT